MSHTNYKRQETTMRSILLQITYLVLYLTCAGASDDCSVIPNCDNCTTTDQTVTCLVCEEGFFVSDLLSTTTVTTPTTTTRTTELDSTTITGASTTGSTSSFNSTASANDTFTDDATTVIVASTFHFNSQSGTASSLTETTTTSTTVTTITQQDETTDPATTHTPKRPGNSCLSCRLKTANCVRCDHKGSCEKCGSDLYLFTNDTRMECLQECPEDYRPDNDTMSCVIEEKGGMETWLIGVIAGVAAAVLIAVIIIIVWVVVKKRRGKGDRRTSNPAPLPSKNEINGATRTLTIGRNNRTNNDVEMTFENQHEGNRYGDPPSARTAAVEDDQPMYENKPDPVVHHAPSQPKPKPKPSGRNNPGFNQGSHQNLSATGSTDNNNVKQKYVNVIEETEEYRRRKEERDKKEKDERDYVNVKKEVDKLKQSRKQPNGDAGHDPPPSGHNANKKIHGYINDPKSRKHTPPHGVPTRPHQDAPRPRRTANYDKQVPVDVDDEEEYVSHDPSSNRPPSHDYYNRPGEEYYNAM